MSGSGGDVVYDQPALNNEINVVPLCDVMLVLLIIFMIVTPTLLQGFQATLPIGDNLIERPDDENAVTVGIDMDGNWYLNKMPVSRENMLPALSAAFAERPEDKVMYLKAHNALPYRDIITIMDVGRDAGALAMAAVSEPATPEGGGL